MVPAGNPGLVVSLSLSSSAYCRLFRVLLSSGSWNLCTPHSSSASVILRPCIPKIRNGRAGMIIQTTFDWAPMVSSTREMGYALA